MAGPRTPKGRARETIARLADEYPGDERDLCALGHDNPFQLLAATILSAQTTDENVNKVTPALFARYPTPADLAAADPDELEALIHSTGFFRSKARSLDRHGVGPGGTLRRRGADRHGRPGHPARRRSQDGQRGPQRRASACPGCRSTPTSGGSPGASGSPPRLDPVKVEPELNALVPARERGRLSLRLILHGRRVCQARSPRCGDCVLADFCPSASRRTGAVKRPSKLSEMLC